MLIHPEYNVWHHLFAHRKFIIFFFLIFLKKQWGWQAMDEILCWDFGLDIRLNTQFKNE